MSDLTRFTSGPVLLAAYTVASSLGLLMIKSGLAGTSSLSLSALLQALASPTFVIGAVLYVFSFVAWIAVLAAMPLSMAYPLAMGLTLACTTAGGAVLLDERLDAAKLAGIACVFAAVVLFTIGSRQ